MSHSELNTLLNRYGGLDGAIVSKIEFAIGSDISKKRISVELKAFLQSNGPESGWRILKISTVGRSLFGWREVPWDTNLVLNYPVKILRVDECDVIDFDPLHATAGTTGILLSSCFLGGAELRIEEIAV
jgi:hypothetical protein